MTAQPDFVYTSALDQARALRDGEIDAVELTELYLRRIDDLDNGPDEGSVNGSEGLNAYLTVAADQALDAARAARRRLDETRDGTDVLPPFLGVPISIKDLLD